MSSVLKTRDLCVYALQTLIGNLQSTAWDVDLGGLVTFPTNFEPALLCLAPHTLAIRYIWRLQFLSLLRVLWCELAASCLASVPAGRMEKQLAEWRKRKPKIVTPCHPLSIFEKCANLSHLLSTPLCPMCFCLFYSFILISGRAQEEKVSVSHV